MNDSQYRPLIGLEIHVELKTKSKMFCQCSADWFEQLPNTNTCPVCLGMPGALPVPNARAIEWILKIGRALNCTITPVSKFDRKHYFYPDLPKGYQISQYDQPFCEHGYIEFPASQLAIAPDNGATHKRFRIRRVHMEEDTGKLTHMKDQSYVDFNRSGVPLVEIVTEADFESSDDVKRFLEELHTIIRYLDVSDANMERGSMRLEPNISVRKPGETGFPPYKVEVKNINSFSFVKKAIDYEVVRQTALLEKGEIPQQETRGYNEDRGITVSQRIKEEAADYRYFPEPDIPPFVFEQSSIDSIETGELPSSKMARYVKSWGVRAADAMQVTRSKSDAEFVERVVEAARTSLTPQQIINLIIHKKLSPTLDVDSFVSQAEALLAPKETDMSALTTCIDEVIGQNPKAVADYQSGKESVLMFLVGQVMRGMKGQAEAAIVKETLIAKLS